MPETRGTSRFGRVVTWLVVLAVVAALVAAAALAGRPEIAIAAAVGVAAAWLVAAYVRLLRKRPVIGVVALFLVLAAAGVTLGLLLNQGEPTTSSEPTPTPSGTPGTLPPGPVSVPYRATGLLSGSTLTLHEEFSYDQAAAATVDRMFGPLPAATAELVVPNGWTAGASRDGYPTYTRTRTFTVGGGPVVSTTLAFPVDLGGLPVRGRTLPLYPRDGSRVELTAAKGSLGSTYPVASSTTDDPRTGGNEITTIPVGPGEDDVSLSVLTGVLRNPAGRQVYEAFTWGPLPWAVGALFALLASIAGDKLRQLLGLAARRVVRRGPVPRRT